METDLILTGLYSSNCSKIFLLNPLGISLSGIKPLGFLNSYLKDIQKDYTNCVLLLFKSDNLEKLQVFVENEYKREGSTLIADYDYSGGYTILVYSIPDWFSDDYEKFLQGKYSKFSNKTKESYPKSIKYKEAGVEKNKLTIQYMVITKNKLWKTSLEDTYNLTFEDWQELWSIPNMEKETLDINQIKKI